MTLNSRKTRLFIVLSVAWVAAWAIGIELLNPGDWENGLKYGIESNWLQFILFGVVPVIVPWARAWILQGKK